MIKALLFATIIAAGTLVSVAAPAQAEDAQRCVRASQCTGPLPFICVYCPKLNHAVCAHHVCVHHRCEVQTCPEFGSFK